MVGTMHPKSSRSHQCLSHLRVFERKTNLPYPRRKLLFANVSHNVNRSDLLFQCDGSINCRSRLENRPRELDKSACL